MTNNSILYSEINLVCALFLFLLVIKVKNSMLLQEQRRLFFMVSISNCLFLIIDAIWIFVNNQDISSTRILNWLLNDSYYILSGILGYYWFAFSETVQDSKLVRVKKYRIITVIPLTVLIILTLASIKTGWLFYIDSQNVYHRGSLYFLQLLTSYGYIIFTAIKAFYLSFYTEDYRKKMDLKTLSIFVLPTLMAGSLQVIFPGYPILCVGNTFGILYVYLTMQEQLVSLDALTKLNNRNQLFQYLSTKIAHPRSDTVLYLLLMDVDHFKTINDQYGHVEGDRALKLVANSLMKACSNRNFFIARFGGDEFVVLCELDPLEPVQHVCDSIHEKLLEIKTPYKLSLSIGYALYTSDIRNQQEFLDRADKELYKAKRNRE